MTLALEVDEIGRCKRVALRMQFRCFPQRHDSLQAWVGQRMKNHRLDQNERGRIYADAKSEGKNRNRCGNRTLDGNPHGIANVSKEVSHRIPKVNYAIGEADPCY